MVEILQVIVLACQVSSGNKQFQVIDKYQKSCQKKLIRCMEKEYWTHTKLSKCLKENR